MPGLCAHTPWTGTHIFKAALSFLDSSSYWNVLKVKVKSVSLKMLPLDLTSLLSAATQSKSTAFMCLKKVFGNISVFSAIHSKNLLLLIREGETRNDPCLQAASRLEWEDWCMSWIISWSSDNNNERDIQITVGGQRRSRGRGAWDLGQGLPRGNET